MSSPTLIRWLAAGAFAASITDPAAGITLTFSKVVDSGTLVPGGSGSFGASFGNPSVDAGRVAFSGGFGANAGTYSDAGGTLHAVVKSGDPIPGGTGGFTTTDPQHFDGGVIPFRGRGSGGQEGAYSVSALGGAVTLIADLNTSVPGGVGNFPDIGGGVDVSAGEYLLNSTVGVYLGMPGSLSVVADLNTALPGGGGNFTSFSTATVSGGQVAFGANSASGRGIYASGGGGLQAVADLTTAVPGAIGLFSSFGAPVVDDGTILFWGRGGPSNQYSGIYASSSGELSVIADVLTAAPGGTGNFLNFGLNAYSIDGGAVVFSATDFGGTLALYTTLGGTLMQVIAVGDTLDGKIISNLGVGLDAIDGSTLAFTAQFEDGSQGVFTATPEPGALLLLAVGGAALGARGRGRRTG